MKIRHGDLLIEKVKSIPKNIKKIEGNVLAEGEITGHKHQLLVRNSENLKLFGEQQVQYFDLRENTKLVHNEHKEIQITKGKYRVIRQKEYSPLMNRQVMD